MCVCVCVCVCVEREGKRESFPPLSAIFRLVKCLSILRFSDKRE